MTGRREKEEVVVDEEDKEEENLKEIGLAEELSFSGTESFFCSGG
jgi:hypothetical protein